VLAVEDAARLTSEERIALLKTASVLGDPEKQADILCGLISAMNEEELLECTRTLLDAQRKGNAWSQEVWNTLWTQWGRVNPEACLALSKTGERYPGWNGLNGLNTYNDYRCLMAGWLDARPDAAMAWAHEAKDNRSEAAGAAFAITHSANGDLGKMEAAILAVSSDKLTARACFRDYFDLAVAAEDKPLPSAVYDRLNPALREAAWSETMERMAYTDPREAAAWLTKHAGDPGCDYSELTQFVSSLAGEDPAGTAQWAIALPVVNPQAGHPAALAFSRWMQADPAAAGAWLESQPEDVLAARGLPVRGAGD
jgi:hypothetical protein